MKTITTKEGRKYNRVSRWIKIELRTLTKRSPLYDYAGSDTYNGQADLWCFRFRGKWYTVNQFERLSYPELFEDEDGKIQVIGGVDCTKWYNPLLCEIDDGGEYIRLYESVNDNS